jgi:hypothetical protein
MRFGISIALIVALLGIASVGAVSAADVPVRTAGYTYVTGTPAPTTSLNLPLQTSSSLQLPVQVTSNAPVTTVGFHHRYGAYYGPRYAYRPYYAPYVVARPYYPPRPYVGFYAPYVGVYGGPAFYRGPAVYGRGYWGGYPGYYW